MRCGEILLAMLAAFSDALPEPSPDAGKPDLNTPTDAEAIEARDLLAGDLPRCCQPECLPGELCVFLDVEICSNCFCYATATTCPGVASCDCLGDGFCAPF